MMTTLFQNRATSQGNEKTPENEELYKAELEEIRETVAPAEIVGRPGDVVFWHHRMVHSGGVNHSADPAWVPSGPCVRMVVPCAHKHPPPPALPGIFLRDCLWL